MRELKFRAWVFYGERLKKPRYSDNDWLYKFFEDCNEDDTDEFGEPQCIEQYTGLKDKNGKEIYEGDIVDYNDDGDCIGYVVYNVPSYKIMGKTGFTCWLKGSPHQRVIGNIHENPELLEQNKKIN